MKNRFREFYADNVDIAHPAKEEPEVPEIARRVAFVLGEAMQRKRQGAPDASPVV